VPIIIPDLATQAVAIELAAELAKRRPVANPEHLELLKQGVEIWNAWRKEEPSIRPVLIEADLVGWDLSHANLSGANLKKANLGKAILRGADLSEADLSEADLSEADLSERADLSETNWDLNWSTRLSRAILSKANLRGANLRGANFEFADLSGTMLEKANLSRATLNRASLLGGNLTGASLVKADLREANLRTATLVGANLSRAILFHADLSYANLSNRTLRGRVRRKAAILCHADLTGADLSGANLTDASFCKAVLRQANLVDAALDGADLTDAHLWETQRSGWSIKGVVCQRAFWDRKGKDPTKYEEGEFERFFSAKPRIVLRYPGGVPMTDLIALPAVVEDLQAKHPESVLEIRLIQNDPGGASVVITVDEASELRVAQIQTELECTIKDRDRLYQLVKDFMARPRHEIHYHKPRIDRLIMGNSKTYTNFGITGAMGDNNKVRDNTFQQTQIGGIDLPKLTEELRRLRNAMRSSATGALEEDEAIGAVAEAEAAAAKGDGPSALRYLKRAGTWSLKVAQETGVALAVEALKKATM
jgi:uncharacterized protein YjbI with pentapeptide repeats